MKSGSELEIKKDYKVQRTWEYIPNNLRYVSNYEAWRQFILRRTKYEYDFFMTITFLRKQPDEIVVQSVNHFLRVLNSYLTDQRYRRTGRYIEGFAFPERHMKQLEKEGSLHVHILGYFPDTFYRKPTLEQLQLKSDQAIERVTNQRGHQLLSPGTVDIQEPYVERGLVNYLSKQMTPSNFNTQIWLVGKEGLIGWETGDFN